MTFQEDLDPKEYLAHQASLQMQTPQPESLDTMECLELPVRR